MFYLLFILLFLSFILILTITKVSINIIKAIELKNKLQHTDINKNSPSTSLSFDI